MREGIPTPGLPASQLSVIIPTRDRWPQLAETLEALRRQSVQGFDVVVVVDGLDQDPPDIPGVTVLTRRHGGPGAARNAGVTHAGGELVLFLGDDTIPEPDAVEAHLEAHARLGPQAVVIGRIDWHPDVASAASNAFMDRHRLQFDFDTIDRGDPPEPWPVAGWGRLYASNLSISAALLDRVGGFDEAFYFLEDLDLGRRLHDLGVEVRYAATARCLHRHSYDLPALERRMKGAAIDERRFVSKHPDFEPWFLPRMTHAASRAPVSSRWMQVDGQPGARRVQERADRARFDHLATSFLDGWDAARDLHDLESYLGEQFDRGRLADPAQAVADEFAHAESEASFYRTSEAYLYDLVAFSIWGVKAPYLRDLVSFVERGSRILDYGCGVGSDGLRLLEAGFDVEFAEFDNPSARFLSWRLERHGYAAPVHDLDGEVPGGFDAAFAFDVIEHVDDPFAFLGELERRARLVVVNFIDDEPGGTHDPLHRALPLARLLDHAAAHDLVRYRRYHDRSHLVVYRPQRASGVRRLRSAAERRAGPVLPASRHVGRPTRLARLIRALEAA